jgi:hypothetical protein
MASKKAVNLANLEPGCSRPLDSPGRYGFRDAS